MFKKYGPLLFIFWLWSCGASSDDSNVVQPTDTLSSSVKVRFNEKTLTVLETANDLQSEIFEACTLRMSPIKGELLYLLENDKTLTLDKGRFDFKRPLAAPKTKAGVADRVFSVWGTSDVITDGITLSIEMELEPELLTFRMTCTG